MHVSGDGLRVVDDDTKGLIVDQTIEKVSFCAPDRNHERGFSYICRDGTTRRWMCHGFLAAKDSGERLSHAVGCAFTVCLERKQRRDTECSVTMTFDKQNSTFTRNGSFRQTTLTDRLHNERGIDIGKKSPAAIVPPQPKPHNPYAIERPHATPQLLERQGSFRGFTGLNSQSPFKRQMSLRLSDLPSNAERQKSFLEPLTNGHTIRTVSPIPEVSAQPQSLNQQQPELDVVSALCKELSQGLSMLSRNDGSDEFNFNLQTVPTTAAANTTSDYVKMTTMPSTISAEALSKIGDETTKTSTSVGSPISIPLSIVSSDYIPMIASTTTTSAVSPISYAHISNRQRGASVSGALPSSIIQHLQTASDDTSTTTKANEFPLTTTSSSTTTTKLSAIVAPNNSQLPNAEQWLGQIVRSVSPAAKRAPPLHTRAKSLTTDPFDAEWVKTVTSKIDEVTKSKLPASADQPIIAHTNPFRSPIKQLDM